MPSFRMISSAAATENDSTAFAAAAANGDTASNVSAANVSLATLASTIAAATRQKWEHNSLHITDPTDPHKIYPPRFMQDTHHRYAAPKIFATPSLSSATTTEDSFTSIAATANGDTTINEGTAANVSHPSTVADTISHASNCDTSAVDSSSSSLDNVAAASVPDAVGSSITSDINIVAAATAADFDASSSTASTTENANITEEDAAITTKNKKNGYIDEGDISTLPAQSVKIRFDQLRWYSVANLSADVYYDPNDASQKPLVLTTMGYGVPNFPVVQEDDDVQKSISRHKGGMHKITDILPDCARSKPWLQKEIMRRCIINNVDPLPEIARWKIQHLVSWLQTNPPPANEHVFILQMWFKLKQKMRDHYMRQSLSQTAVMWRQVRLIEAMLHPDLRADYEGRDDERRPFDANADDDHGNKENEQTRNQRKSYYQKVAELHNSTEILRSRCLSKSYGEPFHERVDLVPPSKDHHLDAEGVRQKTTRMRAAFIDIDEWCREGYPVKDFVQGLDTRGKVPGGDATGYAFLAFRQEAELDDFISYNRKDATTETTVVDISMDETKDDTNNTSKKRKKYTPPSRMSNKKTKNAEEYEDGTSPEMVEEVMTLAERNEIINHVRCQISMVENSILSHRKEVSVFAREYFALKGQVSKGEITVTQEVEEYEYFLYTRKNYLECRGKIEELTERVKTLTKEVERWEKDFEEAKLKMEIVARSR